MYSTNTSRNPMFTIIAIHNFYNPNLIVGTQHKSKVNTGFMLWNFTIHRFLKNTSLTQCGVCCTRWIDPCAYSLRDYRTRQLVFGIAHNSVEDWVVWWGLSPWLTALGEQSDLWWNIHGWTSSQKQRLLYKLAENCNIQNLYFSLLFHIRGEHVCQQMKDCNSK